MDGSRDISTLRIGFELRTGTPLSTTNLETLVSTLDTAMLLENDRFAQAHASVISEFRSSQFRSPILSGTCYPTEAAESNTYLQQFLDQAQNDTFSHINNVRGLISPHIDFPRGGPTYASVWGCTATAAKEVELFVILGTDHAAGSAEITLTRQNYATPWGAIPTDQDAVDEIVHEAGSEVFDLELHHRNEHSVETAAVWLHYLLEGKPLNMLPVLCGSFQSFIDNEESPSQDARICAVVRGLKTIAISRRTLFVAAADLAHVGPAFGDPLPLDVAAKARLADQDQKLIDVMKAGNAEDFFREIKDERDSRRICGMPPIYLMLSTMSEVTGLSTGYAQCPADQDGGSLVSICGMVYQPQTI